MGRGSIGANAEEGLGEELLEADGRLRTYGRNALVDRNCCASTLVRELSCFGAWSRGMVENEMKSCIAIDC
jgi:hypothetical protein